MNKKAIIALLVLLLLLIGLGVGVFLVKQQQEIRKKAAPATSIAILPKNPSTNAGQEFTLNIEMNTSTNEVRGTELHVTYDAQKLTLRDFLPTTILPTVFVSPRIDNTAGTASITLGAQPSNLFSGKQVVATLRFQAKNTAGTANVDFAPQTIANAVSETQDVLVSKTGAQVSILASSIGALSTSPTPTPQGGDTESVNSVGGTGSTTPTPTPSGSSTGGSSMTPTPTPTTRATATPTKKASTSSATVSAQSQPVAGVSWPIVLGLVSGVLLLLLGIVLAL